MSKLETIERSYSLNLFVGFKEMDTDVVHTLVEVHDILRPFLIENPCCVSVKEVEFWYTGGAEPGVQIGFINYPRFPREPKEIADIAHKLAQVLMKAFRQYRVTIEGPQWTTMLSNPEFS